MTDEPSREEASLSRHQFIEAAGIAVGASATADATAASIRLVGGFSGKVAWITGGARGQGRSHALLLAAEGTDTIVSDSLTPPSTIDYALATQTDLDETAERVRAGGQRVLASRSNVRDPEASAAVIRRGTEMFGRIDLPVANAGIYTRRRWIG